MRLAFLGPAGTFGEEAALAYAPAAEFVACVSHAAVAKAVESGQADAGMFAIENSINGSVAETLDVFVHQTRLRIQAEVLLPIELFLVARPGTRPEDVRVISSHPQPLGQCREFLARHFPEAQLEAALSTSAAVEAAMRRNHTAAIGTRRAAEIFGAAVLAEHVQDVSNNVTRFVVAADGDVPPTGRDRTSIAFTFADDRPGSLAGVLNEFARAGINCSKIESRPTRATLGEYVFLVDFDEHAETPQGRAVLDAIRPLCSEVKVFGSYPRAR
ncbi:prephenate dehydratase [bacterium]|nr:prephenate dehydratase [bacterium]